MRTGLKVGSDSDYLSSENSLNDLRQLIENAQITGAASNRQVTINPAAAVEITPTAGAKELHIFNDTGVGVRYGGSGVTTSTGGKIFNNGSLALRVNSSTSLYLIPESGGDVNIEIVEFS